MQTALHSKTTGIIYIKKGHFEIDIEWPAKSPAETPCLNWNCCLATWSATAMAAAVPFRQAMSCTWLQKVFGCTIISLQTSYLQVLLVVAVLAAGFANSLSVPNSKVAHIIQVSESQMFFPPELKEVASETSQLHVVNFYELLPCVFLTWPYLHMFVCSNVFLILSPSSMP